MIFLEHPLAYAVRNVWQRVRFAGVRPPPRPVDAAAGEREVAPATPAARNGRTRNVPASHRSEFLALQEYLEMLTATDDRVEVNDLVRAVYSIDPMHATRGQRTQLGVYLRRLGFQKLRLRSATHSRYVYTRHRLARCGTTNEPLGSNSSAKVSYRCPTCGKAC